MTTAPGTEPPIRLRPARPDDLPACVGVWHAGLTEYGMRVGRPAMPPSFGPLLGLLGHLLATDPQGFLVAVADGAGPGGAPTAADPADPGIQAENAPAGRTDPMRWPATGPISPGSSTAIGPSRPTSDV